MLMENNFSLKIGVTANVLVELDSVSDEFTGIQVLKLSVDT